MSAQPSLTTYQTAHLISYVLMMTTPLFCPCKKIGVTKKMVPTPPCQQPQKAPFNSASPSSPQIRVSKYSAYICIIHVIMYALCMTMTVHNCFASLYRLTASKHYVRRSQMPPKSLKPSHTPAAALRTYPQTSVSSGTGTPHQEEI